MGIHSPKLERMNEIFERSTSGIYAPSNSSSSPGRPRDVIVVAPERPEDADCGSSSSSSSRQTWREISVVTLILCPPLGFLCLIFSCLASKAFHKGLVDIGRKRAKMALRLCIFTMALYGCALIIYVTFRIKYGEETRRFITVGNFGDDGDVDDDGVFLGYV